MAATYDRELPAILLQSGCKFARHGRHDIWYSPVSERQFPVRSGIKSRHTANEVLKQAGVPKAV
jgi:hypothetical protein